MKYVFTITGGRTGTAWLTQLFDLNFKCTSVHEYLQFGDIGRRSPDIGVMQVFNHWGNNDRVQNFWKRKFAALPKTDFYVETNHALAKGGLIENLDKLPDDLDIYFITMRRDWTKQALSYLNRYDFYNYTTIWQWYLDYRYGMNILPYQNFPVRGMLGHILWYMAEVEVRQEYYKQLYSDRFTFVEAKLENATKQKGAEELLAKFGHKGSVYLPEKANANVNNTPPIAPERVAEIVSRVNFDPEKIAKDFIASGRRLGDRASFEEWQKNKAPAKADA